MICTELEEYKFDFINNKKCSDVRNMATILQYGQHRYWQVTQLND